MTIKAAGTLSFSEIQAEFGGAHPISLSEYYRGGGRVPSGTSAIPASGAIKLSNFYGTSNVVTSSAPATFYVSADHNVKTESPPDIFWLGGAGSAQRALFANVIDYKNYAWPPDKVYLYNYSTTSLSAATVVYWGFKASFTMASQYIRPYDGSTYYYEFHLLPVMLFRHPPEYGYNLQNTPAEGYISNISAIPQLPKNTGTIWDNYQTYPGIDWRPNISGSLYYNNVKYTDLSFIKENATYNNVPYKYLKVVPADGNTKNKFLGSRTNPGLWKLEINYSPA